MIRLGLALVVLDVTRGSPGHGVLKTTWELPVCRGLPKWCSHTVLRSLKAMPCGLARIALTILSTDGTHQWYYRRYYPAGPSWVAPWPRCALGGISGWFGRKEFLRLQLTEPGSVGQALQWRNRLEPLGRLRFRSDAPGGHGLRAKPSRVLERRLRRLSAPDPRRSCGTTSVRSTRTGS